MTTRYLMSETGNGMHDSSMAWEPCKATTPAGAKREAIRELGAGYRDHTIHVGAQAEGEPVQRLASRRLCDERWEDA